MTVKILAACGAGVNSSHQIKDAIEKEFKKFAKSTKNSLCKFSYRSNYKKHSEQPIKLTIENMTLVEYPCCKRSFKIKPLLRLCGSYCPYCGEKYYGIE